MAKVRTPTIFTTPQDAATAFYRAFEARDIDAMMAAWAEDEDIVCVHPGGPRLVGFDAVRVGWEQIFAGETKLLFRLEDLVVLETVGMALQSAIEQVTVGDNPAPRGTAIASNVFLRTPSGWRIVLHHASPAPTMTIASPAGPLH
jgi:ketosteroid isomerase-like protein